MTIRALTRRLIKPIVFDGFERLEPRNVLSAVPAVPQILGDVVEQHADDWSRETWPTDIGQARTDFGLQGYGQTVAIIDSGIAYDHPALGGGFGTDYRVVGGWDFAEADADPFDDDPGGFHGTHVAGILASSDIDYTGVASGVDLVALRVFDDQGGSSFDWIEQSLVWVHNHRFDFESPITVVNMSLGAQEEETATLMAQIEDELSRLSQDGILVTASTGNQFNPAAPTTVVTYPAASQYVIPVGSVDADGQLSAFSQRNHQTLVAPGENITSTAPDYLYGFDGVTDDFVTVSGTSMAAPHIAGAAVLVREAFTLTGQPSPTPASLYQHLQQTSDLVYDASTDTHYARVNLVTAIEQAIPADEDPGGVTLLGSRGVGQPIRGVINEVTDQDTYDFVANQSGRLRFSLDWDHPFAHPPDLLHGGVNRGDTFSLNVLAGQHYRFSVSGAAAIGSYTVGIASIESSPAPPIRSVGELGQEWIAPATGHYTLQALLEGNSLASVHILLPNGTAVVSTAPSTGAVSLPFQAIAGTTYSIAVRGNRPAAELTILSNNSSGAGQTIVLNQVARQSTIPGPTTFTPSISIGSGQGVPAAETSSNESSLNFACECSVSEGHDVALGSWQSSVADVLEHVARAAHRSSWVGLDDGEFADANLPLGDALHFVLVANYPLPQSLAR